MLTDDAITAGAGAHVCTWYGEEWEPRASVRLSDPDGVFFRCQRHDGVENTGMPTLFFIYRHTGRVLNLGHGPELTQAEIEVLQKTPAAFHALSSLHMPQPCAFLFEAHLRRHRTLRRWPPSPPLDRRRSATPA